MFKKLNLAAQPMELDSSDDGEPPRAPPESGELDPESPRVAVGFFTVTRVLKTLKKIGLPRTYRKKQDNTARQMRHGRHFL